MSTKMIPAHTIVTCDLCGQVEPRRKKAAKLILERAALDMYGEAAADGTARWDLCDACEGEVAETLNELKSTILTEKHREQE
jgi:hypothetical protein